MSRAFFGVFLCVLASLVAPAWADDAYRQQIKGLDEQVQEVKSDVLSIAAELNQLEEKLLYPSNTHVAVFVTLAEAEAFRLEVRHWLAKNLTDDIKGLYNRGEMDIQQLQKLKVWNKLMADARYVAISWPEAFGGRNAGVMEQVVLAEEMHAAGAPAPLNPIGLNNIAPSIMAYGSDEQKEKYLKPMLSGEHIWCQGFSEPSAGSDLRAR